MIGVFDSGIGGLSVWREIVRLLPGAPIHYFADQANVPYGRKSLEEVRELSVGITRFLRDQGVAVVVVACNTASAAALRHLRVAFPGVSFVGMEPAVKPAAQLTRSGHVGVLATPVTFQGELFAGVVERFTEGVRLTCQICPGLVEQVEKGELDAPKTVELLHTYLDPMLEAGVDSIVLACTHYAFLAPAMTAIAGPEVRIIDPAPAVAAQTRRIVEEHGLAVSSGSEPRRLWTTSDPRALELALGRFGLRDGTSVSQAAWGGRPPSLTAS